MNARGPLLLLCVGALACSGQRARNLDAAPIASATTTLAPQASALNAPGEPGRSAPTLYLGRDVSCSLNEHKSLTCWGARWPIPFDTGIPKGAQVVSASALGSICTTDAARPMRCWPPLSEAVGQALEVDGAGDLVESARWSCVHHGGHSATCFDRSAGASSKAVVLKDVLRVVPSDQRLCAIRTDRKVWCIGHPEDWRIPDLEGAKSLFFGSWDTCILTVANDLVCRMSRKDPDHPNRSQEITTTKTLVSDVADTTLGGTSCLRTRAGAAFCWSWDKIEESLQRLDVPNAIRELAVQSTRVYTVSVDGRLYVKDFALRGFSIVPLPEPNRVAGLGSGWTMCVRTEDGQVWCDDASWGTSDGTPAAPKLTRLGGLDGTVELAVSAEHACARKGDGSVWCWGNNQQGQLGLGSVAIAPVGFAKNSPRYLLMADESVWRQGYGPMRVQRLEGVPPFRVLALTPQNVPWIVSRSGDLYAWDPGCRENESSGWQCRDGALADDQTADPFPPGARQPESYEGLLGPANTPFKPNLIRYTQFRGVLDVAVGPDEIDILGNDGSVAHLRLRQSEPIVPGSQAGSVDVRRGRFVSVPGVGCTIDSGGTLRCNGPCAIEPLRHVKAASVQHARFGCAVTSEGEVWCWGENVDGELGRPATRSSGPNCDPKRRYVAQRIPGLSEVEVVQTGANSTRDYPDSGFACALRHDGTVWCWGSAHFGELGARVEPNTWQPAAIVGLKDVRRLSLGEANACAVRDRDMVCWGRGYIGTPRVSIPTPIAKAIP